MEGRKSKRNVDNTSGRRTIESVDRISALPDSILSVILSSLPTKNALATSALSKRWEFLWRTVHNLDFCLEKKGRRAGQDGNESKKFIEFVNHVLLHHDPRVLNKFSLVWTHDCVQSLATSWIKTAITRNVNELSLAFDRSRGFDIPISILSCDSLRSLELSGRIYLSVATAFCFPRLEFLDLYGGIFESKEAFEKIIRGCPVLNYLLIDMSEDHVVNDFGLVISSTSLRRVVLILGYRVDVKLEASSLEHLEIYGCNISVNFAQKKLTSLVEADFGMYWDDRDPASKAGICNAVSALECAKILTLSASVMGELSCGTARLSTNFERLVILEASINCCHWSSLLDFIQLSNNLEALTIEKIPKDPLGANAHDHSNWTTPIEVPNCLSNSLKKVVLTGYCGNEDERELIRYMLNHGSVLEVMQITCHRDEIHKEIELLLEIREFPRKSTACEVKFSGWTGSD